MLDLKTPEPPIDPPEPIDWYAYQRGKDAWDELRADCDREEMEEE